MSSAATWQATDLTGLRQVTATVGPVGVILGREHSGALVPVRLLRPEATRMVLVGGGWATRLLVFRCLAVGSVVVVTTMAPARWLSLAEQAGAAGRLQVQSPDTYAEAQVMPASVQPVLHVNDIGLTTAAARPALGPWQTSLLALPVLTSQAASMLTEANVVVLQRLGSDEAEICANTLRLPPAAVTRLQQLHDEMLVLVIGGELRYLWFATTSIEDEILGPPQRTERSVAGVVAG
jgi:hypothetical protein